MKRRIRRTENPNFRQHEPCRTAEEYIEALRKSNGLISAAAAALKVNTGTVHVAMKRWPEVEAVAKEEREKFLDLAESQLMKCVKKGQAWAICFTLKTIGRSRGYVEKQELEHSGSVGTKPEDLSLSRLVILVGRKGASEKKD